MGNKEYSVELNLTKSGTSKFATATKENIGKQIAIIYDGETIQVRSYGLRSQVDRPILQATSLMKKQIIWHLRSVSVD